MLFFSWYGFFCKAESCLCCHAAGVCNDFINDRKHAVILELNCLKQKRVLRETLYISVCHMIGRGEYEGKLVPKVEMNCIKWNFAVFFFFTRLCSATPPTGHFNLSRQRDSFGFLMTATKLLFWSMNWFQVLVLPHGSCYV